MGFDDWSAESCLLAVFAVDTVDGMLAGLMMDDGSKSEGSMSDGSESLSDTSSILAFRDMMGVRCGGGWAECGGQNVECRKGTEE